MKLRLKIAACATFAMFALPSAFAGAPDPELVALDEKLPGQLVNDPRQLLDLVNQGGNATKKIVKSDKIPGGGAALQVNVGSVPDQPWRIGANMVLSQPIARGDVVTVGFYARALPNKQKEAKGRVNLRIQQNTAPWPGFLDKTIDIGSEWQWYEAAGVATVAMPASGASVGLSLGTMEQTVELGQIIVVKGANAIATDRLPQVVMPPSLAGIAGKLINRPDGGPWNFYGAAGTQVRVDDKNIFMGKASRVTVNAAGGNPWDLTAGIPLSGAIKAGDRIHVAVAIKTVSAATADGKANVAVRFQSTQPPYSGFSDNVMHPGANWQLLQFRTTAGMDLEDGKATFNLMFAGTKQVVDLGPVYIFKLD